MDTEGSFLGVKRMGWRGVGVGVQLTFHLHLVFFFFYWRYNPLWVLAFSVILFHSALPLHNFPHPLISIICISSSMPSIHLFVGLPLFLLPVGFHSNSFRYSFSYLLLVGRLIIHGAVPSLPLHTSVAWSETTSFLHFSLK